MARRIVAYHEAGHAVIARDLDARVDHFSMIDGEQKARTHSASYAAVKAGGDRVRAAEIDAMVALAGEVAQVKHAPDTGRLTHSEDQENAFNAVMFSHFSAAGLPIPDDGAEVQLTDEIRRLAGERLTRITAEVEELVDHHWGAITRVAEALTVRDLLHETQLDALIAGPGLADQGRRP